MISGTDDESREIIIRISEDHSGIQYKSNSKGAFASLEVWRTIKFSDMKGILYGGVSMTFKERKKPIIEMLNKQRWS